MVGYSSHLTYGGANTLTNLSRCYQIRILMKTVFLCVARRFRFYTLGRIAGWPSWAVRRPRRRPYPELQNRPLDHQIRYLCFLPFSLLSYCCSLMGCPPPASKCGFRALPARAGPDGSRRTAPTPLPFDSIRSPATAEAIGVQCIWAAGPMPLTLNQGTTAKSVTLASGRSRPGWNGGSYVRALQSKTGSRGTGKGKKNLSAQRLQSETTGVDVSR